MTAPKEFTIDRSLWRRGQGGDESKLRRRKDGLQCCLGFFGAACGVADEHLVEVEYPLRPDLSERGDPAWPAWLFDGTDEKFDQRTQLASDNDNRCIDDETREARIAARFAKHGITVRFVDGQECK